jgi:hypothetical protein
MDLRQVFGGHFYPDTQLIHTSFKYVLKMEYGWDLWLNSIKAGRFLGGDELARTYLQPHYGNGFFGNVYLSAGQH